jgi:hypothetical protein
MSKKNACVTQKSSLGTPLETDMKPQGTLPNHFLELLVENVHGYVHGTVTFTRFKIERSIVK